MNGWGLESLTTKYKVKESFGYSCFECVFLLTINSPFTPLHWGADDVCIINLRKCLYPEKNKTGKKELKHNIRFVETTKKRAFLRAEGENNQKRFLWTQWENASKLKRRMRKFIYSMANFPKAGAGVYFEALASMEAGTVQKSSDC